MARVLVPGGGGAKGGGSDGGQVGGVGVQSGGDNSLKGCVSDTGKMVAPGTGGLSQILRDSFESNPKGYSLAFMLMKRLMRRDIVY